MSRKFTKYPLGYIKSATDMFGDTYPDYPDVIYYDAGHGIEYKYLPKYLHDAEPKHNNMQGMYYDVAAVRHAGGDFEPISQDAKYYMFGISEIDVYPDKFVGFLWDGRLRSFGYLDGDTVVKDV